MSEWIELTLSLIAIITISTIITYVSYNLRFIFDKIKRLFKRKPKYKVGQKVRVIRNLSYDKEYGERRVYSSMLKHVGNVVTIKYIDVDSKGNQYISIVEDFEDTWVADMLEPIKIKKEDAFEALLYGHINDEEYTVIMKKRGRRG